KSSNTLSKACLFQKPILVAEGKYLIAERVKRFNLGMTINENSVEECVNAIDAILDLSEQELSESGFDDYLLKNSEQKLVEILGKVFS
ncbi:MAG: ABC-type lipopolysaccharide export system ATPase subunit, partial [Arenicella sp.]